MYCEPCITQNGSSSCGLRGCKKKGYDNYIMTVSFDFIDDTFKLWLAHWENIMHAYLQENGIRKKRLNHLIRNNLFYKHESKKNIFTCGDYIDNAVLSLTGIGWKHGVAQINSILSF